MELTDSLNASLPVSSLSNLNSPHPRFAQYKVRNNVPDQYERRRRLLEEQKQKRCETFNASRGLIEELNDVTEEHDMEWTAVKAKTRQCRVYRGRLMLSEWLVHVPEDLAELWYLVPCPEGRRTLVVATGGNTRAYSKSGYHLATFQSILPGGNHDDFKGYTILDCIWNVANYSYYVLDVLAWSNQPMLDCETEFRFYWLKSKMEETSCLSRRSNDNAFPFVSLPYHHCNVSIMTNIMATEHLFGQDGPALDGLLFYHSQTHYIPGNTPLVGWLKPHMMPVVLNVPVAPVYLQKMESNKRSEKKKNRRYCKSKDVVGCHDSMAEMETNILDDTQDSYSESHVEEMESEDKTE